MNITDNVLSQKLFDDLYYNITETDFPWYLQNTGVSVEGDGSFQFTHQSVSYTHLRAHETV